MLKKAQERWGDLPVRSLKKSDILQWLVRPDSFFPEAGVYPAIGSATVTQTRSHFFTKGESLSSKPRPAFPTCQSGIVQKRGGYGKCLLVSCGEFRIRSCVAIARRFLR
jgi:hypothetical protein